MAQPEFAWGQRAGQRCCLGDDGFAGDGPGSRLGRRLGWRLGRHHHDRVDAGDVLAGILIIGGIAAIASAASNNKQKRAEPEYRYPDAPARPGFARLCRQ